MERAIDHKILWQQVQQGDKKAFEALFRLFYQSLCNYCNGLIKDIDESEEVVQTLFYNLWLKRASLSINSSVKAYLYQAAHNDCLNRIKHRKTRQAYANEIRHTTSFSGGDTSATLQAKQLRDKIDSAIQTLPDQCRRVFTMNRFNYLSYAEIAATLSISVKTVEVHMGKALRLMREQLKDYLTLLVLLISDAL